MLLDSLGLSRALLEVEMDANVNCCSEVLDESQFGRDPVDANIPSGDACSVA